MRREEVKAVLRRILIEDFQIQPERITGDATLSRALGLDSMDTVDFLLLIHKEFGFEEDLESYRNLDTFSDLVSFVESRLEAQRTDGR